MRSWCVLSYLLLLSVVIASPAVGQGDDMLARGSLSGVGNVRVVIESPGPEAEGEGLTSQRLRTDVEVKLRTAGVPVSDDSTRGGPFLYLNVGVFRGHQESIKGLYAYNVEVSFYQAVSLERLPSYHPLGRTWSVSALGMVGQNHMVDGIRDAVRDLADLFINAYLAANPKR